MKLTDRFNRKNPAVVHKFIGQPKALEELRKLNDRIATIKEKQTIHFLSNRSRWISLEAAKVWQERRDENYPKPTPPNGGEMYAVGCLEEARQRVSLRMKAREKALKATGVRMQKQLLDYYRPQKNKKHLLQEIQTIIHRTSRVQNTAKKYFERDKQKWLNAARNKKMRSPVKDQMVYEKFQSRLDRIRKAKENEIYRAYERHGVAPKRTLEQEFTHEQQISSH